ncbi:MAG TPA: (2Fe-2S)-binding protein [Candidatus Ozemobacteraceae bacterium]|nr:(2Fe-2S)-binding protein [Candidatus Ozemobacteraceae bacterium]HQG27907.1 (2Fe-2S)-binding protein [Candidatus Ozemobacteraceae bacterium]
MSGSHLVQIRFQLNGRNAEAEVEPATTLLELLRRTFRLTAAKEGCGKGECGACTVLLNGEPVNSCLKLAATLRPEDRVETLEGLETDPLMTTVQQAYVDAGAVQCGFCIPGMVMSSYSLLKRVPQPIEHQIKEALSGNICRCTGYRKIVAAVRQAGNIAPIGAKGGRP